MQYDHIYIDVVNVYHRHFHARDERYVKVSGKNFPVHGIESSLNWIDRIKSSFLKEGGKMHLCIDNYTSRPMLRKEFDPTYKQGRTKQSPIFYKSLKTLTFILCYYDADFLVYHFRGLEADDFVPHIIKNNEGERHLVVSGDFDWARCIDTKGPKKVDWHNCQHVVSRSEFIDKYGFEPTEQNVIAYKTYRGDSSDNIPVGWPHLQKPLLEKLMEYGSVMDVLDDLDHIDFMTTKQKQQMLSHKSRLLLNHQLVSFIPLSAEVLKKSTFKSKPNMRLLRKVFLLLSIENSKVKAGSRASFPKVTMENFFQS